jgi:prephenate dehydrogenase
LKQRRLARRVVGVGRRPSSLRRAREAGAVDVTTTRLERGVGDADVVVVCTPVSRIADQVRQAAAHCRRDCLLTDAGSTKRLIVERLSDLGGDGPVFVGSHPLAGSEQSGVASARADLFQGRVCVMTPTPRTPRGAQDRVRALWEAVGAEVVVMTPQAHDRALAFTSHLPHLVAVALASTLPEGYEKLVATGMRDTTRIASGDPELWVDIFEQNREKLLEGLKAFDKELAQLRRALESQDNKVLHRLLAQAKQSRDRLG